MGQWSCREAPCPRKAFTGQIPELPASARVTGRLRRHVARRVADGLALHSGCCSRTVRTGGWRHDIAYRLHRFNSWCARSGLPEPERLAGTIQAWWLEVLGFLRTQVTNAGTEATDRTVKTAARTAYGFRNLDNQRRRVRFVGTRRATLTP